MNHKADYQRIYRYIVEYKRQHDGLSPSVRQIAARFAIPSTAHVKYILDWLEDHGQIKRIEGARGIMVEGGKWVLSRKADNGC
jgi:hypothetical protein